MKKVQYKRALFKSFLLLPALLLIIAGCKKDQMDKLKLITKPAQSITQTRAVVGCEVINGEGKYRIYYGICWGLAPGPTVDSSKLDYSYSDHEDGFYFQIPRLKPEKTYYVRAYAYRNGQIIYGNEISFTTLPGTIGTVTDIDGNIYTTVIIGQQVWMVENLKTTRYRNGDTIPYVSSISQWDTLTSGAYCYYDNDSGNSTTYGNLYNWFAATDTRNIAPEGWHAASDSDWRTLINYLTNLSGYVNNVKMLIEDGTEHWSENSSFYELNETGFTALPGGKLGEYGNENEYGYENITKAGYWWSTTEYYPFSTYYYEMFSSYRSVKRKPGNKTNGFSIRCVRDQLYY